MFRNAQKTADEWGDTGWYMVRTILIYCIGYVTGYIQEFCRQLQGDLDDWIK